MSCRSCFASHAKQSSQEKAPWLFTVDEWVSSNRCIDLFIERNFSASYHAGFCLHEGESVHPDHWNRKIVMNLHLEKTESSVGKDLGRYFLNVHRIAACNCGQFWSEQLVDSLEIQRHYVRLKKNEENKWCVVKRFID